MKKIHFKKTIGVIVRLHLLAGYFDSNHPRSTRKCAHFLCAGNRRFPRGGVPLVAIDVLIALSLPYKDNDSISERGNLRIIEIRA